VHELRYVICHKIKNQLRVPNCNSDVTWQVRRNILVTFEFRILDGGWLVQSPASVYKHLDQSNPFHIQMSLYQT